MLPLLPSRDPPPVNPPEPVLVLVPAFNEEGNIGDLIDAIRREDLRTDVVEVGS